MSLIKSISGIRGTIGGKPGDNLTPIDIVECTAAYGFNVLKTSGINKVVVGRDARISGEMVNGLVVQTLIGLGINVVDLGLSTTPTVEMAVPMENAGGGIIITASHNPKQWNALKFLNEKGEFISAETGQLILDMIDEGDIDFAQVDDLGSYFKNDSYIQKHIDIILDLPYVSVDAIKTRGFKVVVDCINSTGAISVIPLLEQLGCEVIAINEEVNGYFAHNPEPLAKHLKELSDTVVNLKADLGISIDPDVDRLAFVSENGEMFGEEYTLVAVADLLLELKGGNTVSNLSSTRALADVTKKWGGEYFASAVGEVNVVNKMKECNATIGGEGNGGIIFPELHSGRDALVGIALFLSLICKRNCTLSSLRESYPAYYMAKDRMDLTPEIDMEHLLKQLAIVYAEFNLNTIDGLKIDKPEGWIHLRKSNTEPIIRIYTEAGSQELAQELADEAKEHMKLILA